MGRRHRRRRRHATWSTKLGLTHGRKQIFFAASLQKILCNFLNLLLRFKVESKHHSLESTV